MTQPRCPYFSNCGGCQHQNVAYKQQLRNKQQLLKELYNQDVPITSHPTSYAYRNRMDFVCTSQGIGLRGASHEDIVDIQTCAIAQEPINQALQTIREWVRTNNIPCLDVETKEGFLRYASIRTGNNQLQVTLTTASEAHEQAIDELAKQLNATSLVWTVEEASISQTIGSRTNKVYGEETITLTLADKEFLIDAHTFFQTSPYMAEQAIKHIKQYVNPDERVHDLYCGVGVLGQCVSNHVVGVEQVAQSVKQARKNAQINGVQATYYCADAAAWLMGQQPTTVLVDPPRAGLGVGAQTLLAAKPQTIVYLSCNPKSQKRDLVHLQQAYELVDVQGFDFFAHTDHVECLAVLKRR